MSKRSVSGIYVILNTINHKIYLGQAQDIRKRWGEHRHTLKYNKHKNRHLQAAWNKYGAKAFEFKILEYCTIEQLDKREDHYLKTYMPKGICYNVIPQAGTTRGMIYSEESRLKMSEGQKRRHQREVENKKDDE